MMTPSRLLLFALALAFCVGATAAAPKKPNVVFILIDDMGWKDLSVQGSRYYETPNIDKLAEEGVRFTNGYSAAAICSPSRGAILTGRSPARLHITDWIPGRGPRKEGRFQLPDWTQQLDPKLPNLARVFHDQGYTTASIGKWHLGGEGHSPQDAGFDVNIAGGHIGHPANYFWPYGAKDAPRRVPMLAEAGGEKGEYLTDRLTDEAIRFIGKNQKQPFFLYLAHYAVHMPLMAKPEDRDKFRGKPGSDGQDFPLYAGMVKSVDDSVGRILAELKKLGLEDNTIVVFTSDNGGVVTSRATSMKPLRAGKSFPYEGGIRVPFIVKAPGVSKAGLVTDAPAVGTDFLPTLASLSGKKLEGVVLDGVDLTPVLRGEKTAPREIGWHYPHYNNAITPFSVLRAGDWKIIRWYEYGNEEIYDLASDPYEKKDLAQTNPEKRKELIAKLDAWLKANDAQVPALKKNAPGPLDPKTNPAAADKWR